MRADPRCPHCSEKVSATATWCMHCGADFSTPIDASGGQFAGEASMVELESALEAGDVTGATRLLRHRTDGSRLVGVALGIVALVTLPLVAPAGVTWAYLAAVVAIGAYAARQPSVDDAVRDGGTALAVAPILLWIVAAVLRGFAGVSAVNLLGPALYAGAVLFAVRRLT
ncbi:zinc ribbon domain-containing protein [Halomicroarcula limicola]|uniref:Zinc ribbon domain-containing protein n=1 Tax=Haloarcula limicola TaxID=1429915 RepID=A0A8J7YB78_9EURY|nr:zinc ribbon domain-containing protein [Halomicroarcula limicola]MBV0925426.1 zinc ribbon domain-containing protein [Halomicroarcula limicola]